MTEAEQSCDQVLLTVAVKFEYWRSSLNRLWYWHLKTTENEKLAQGEAYPTEAACLEAIERVRQSTGAVVENLSPRDR
ncbi:YegP family protein [Opitutus terrae]|uniref:DUF1508 domain-containing protein n=1 Tax=Opitutus terrae (strain DSM 11246 / JCM 15787 / PB90-1) TaxID=452637 RepID=B1ZMG8_OPITP|nr:YegP family protein [Opitutus terrae]ACB73421.1 hypothetical protein Oter_0130 [Opitutus terrae PB90-1]